MNLRPPTSVPAADVAPTNSEVGLRRLSSYISSPRRRTSLFVAATLFAGLASTAAAQSVSAVDGRGKRLSLSAPPKRIVSLTPSNTEILFALGLNGRIVADTAQCDFPPEAKSLPHIGDFRISVEQVVAQRPDLVLAIPSMNRTAIEQLERLKVPVFCVDPESVDQTCDAIRRIGVVTATTPRAEQIVREMKARINGIASKCRADKSRGGAPQKVLLVIQAKPLMVAGTGTFMDEMVRLASGVNAASEVNGYRAFSPERAIALQPDVVIGDRDAAGLPGWSVVPAVKNRRVYSPPRSFVRPGPRLPDSLEFVARLLHPSALPKPR